MWTARTGSRPSRPSWPRPAPSHWLAGLLASLLASAAAAQPAPPRNRIYPLQGTTARLPVEATPGAEYQVQTEAGAIIRPWGPAGPDGTLRLPPGGWYRLIRRDAVGEAEALGHRFAAGLVILVTGQSQAAALFADGPAVSGAFPPEATDPPAPPVSVLLQTCDGRPGCGADGTTWTKAGDRLGARALLAGLARRLGPGLPLALANAAWGGAGAADLADPASPAGRNLRRIAAAAAPASAALILAHGTADALLGTPAEAYVTSMAQVVAAMRATSPAMPVLLAPLSPLLGQTRLLGSGSLPTWLLPWDSTTLARRPLDPQTEAAAAAIRQAQQQLRRDLDLGHGGDMAGVTPGLDGIHWTAQGLRLAVREAAAALAAALAPPP
jgi:hypothetical protein